MKTSPSADAVIVIYSNNTQYQGYHKYASVFEEAAEQQQPIPASTSSPSVHFAPRIPLVASGSSGAIVVGINTSTSSVSSAGTADSRRSGTTPAAADTRVAAYVLLFSLSHVCAWMQMFFCCFFKKINMNFRYFLSLSCVSVQFAVFVFHGRSRRLLVLQFMNFSLPSPLVHFCFCLSIFLTNNISSAGGTAATAAAATAAAAGAGASAGAANTNGDGDELSDSTTSSASAAAPDGISPREGIII